MSEVRIVTPEEAANIRQVNGHICLSGPDHTCLNEVCFEAHHTGNLGPLATSTMLDLAHTVATEPDRTRAAVVEALRNAAGLREPCAKWASDGTTWQFPEPYREKLRKRADAIAAGGDW